jgi:hypothetical protein
MKMPGYTAEASLGRAGVYWHSAAAGHMIVVQPQLRKTDYECVHDCLEAGGPTDICNFFCTESGDEGGGGGGGGQQCRPGCGPVSVTRTRALADLERALPLIAIPILGAASIGFVLHTQLSCKCCTSMWRRTFIITLNLKKGA